MKNENKLTKQVVIRIDEKLNELIDQCINDFEILNDIRLEKSDMIRTLIRKGANQLGKELEDMED